MSRGRLPSYEILPATFVVAKEGSSKNIRRADYVCPASSVSDQTYINAAINALPTVGGRVFLLEGTYIIDNNILPKSNVLVDGTGYSTEVKIKDAINAAVIMFFISVKDNVIIKNMKLNGNKTNRVGNNQYGISLGTANYCNFENIYFTDIQSYSVNISTSSTYNKVIGCKFVSTATLKDIYILGTSNNNIVANNVCTNGGPRFTEIVSSHNNIIVNNIVNTNSGIGVLSNLGNYNKVVDNFFSGLTSWGVQFDSAINNTAKENTILGGYGMYLNGSTDCIINSNTITQALTRGIYLIGSSNNTIVSNHIKESSQLANDTYSGIAIDSNSDGNNVQANTIRRGALANQAKYGIDIVNANCDNNLVTNNDLLTSGVTASLHDVGTGTITAAGNRL